MSLSWQRCIKRLALVLIAAATVVAVTVYFGLAVGAMSAFSMRYPTSASTPASSNAVPVSVASVKVGPVPLILDGIGTVQAYNTVKVHSRIDGQITEVLFREGQDVTEGDALVRIDPRPLQATLRQRTAARQRNEARLAVAVLDMKRYDQLQASNFASRQQVERQHALVAELSAQVQDEAAQVDFAQQQLDYTTVTAPISGRIGLRQIDVGNFVRASSDTKLAIIVQLKPISVVFTVAATLIQASNVGPGLASSPVAVLGQDGMTLLDRGTIEAVDNQVDPTSGTIKLKGKFPNDMLKLWPGDFVNGRITVGEKADGLTLPPASVRHGPRGDYVWLVNADATVTPCPIKPGQTADGRILIESGLKAGDRVVVEGYYRLEPGSRVVVQPTSTAPPGR